MSVADRRRAAALFLGLAIPISGSACRDRQCEPKTPGGGIVVAISSVERCPEQAEAQERYRGYVTVFGETVVSIDSGPTREERERPRQACCYPARFVSSGSEQMGLLCRDVSVPPTVTAADVKACPPSPEALATASFFRLARPGEVPLGVVPEDVRSLEEASEATAFVAGTASCQYLATKSDGDGCP